MENVKTFFDSFKEFIWDIIGYLLPGSFLLILLSACINKEYFISPSIGAKADDFYNYTFIIVSYILGYVIYGFGWLKESILGKYSYVKRIESSFSNRKNVILSKELLSKALEAKGITDDLTNATLRDIRNLAMSFAPEQDQKIYTFTFRAELSNQIGNTALVMGILGLIFSCFKFIPLQLFKTSLSYIILYVCLLASYYFLVQTRNRFYAISIGLPFSIYTANAIK